MHVLALRRTKPLLALTAALAVAGGATLAPLTGAAAPSPGTPAASWADLRVDANRDGAVDTKGTTNADDQVASVGRGAVFLANVDDDSRRCQLKKGKDFFPLAKLVACHDGADTIVNGAADEKDLAPLATPALNVPKGAVGHIYVEGAGASHTRLFLRRGTQWVHLKKATAVPEAELRAGLRIGLEGTDILRDTKKWDGTARVRLDVTVGKQTHSDTAVLRQAPLTLHNHTQALRTLVVPDKAFPDAKPVVKRITDVLRLRGIKATPLTGAEEQWIQDSFEPMYQHLPGRTAPHSMRVLVQTDQTRQAHQALFQLRGRNVGVVRSGTEKGAPTLDSGGNIETLPPYVNQRQQFPLGRVLMGHRETDPNDYPKGDVVWSPKTDDTAPSPAPSAPASPAVPADTTPDESGPVVAPRHDDDDDHDHAPEPKEPSAAMVALLKAQSGAEPLTLDTGFLSVGHVDEFMTVVPARNARGWRIVVADPAAGIDIIKKLIADGHGKTEFMKHGGTIESQLELGFLERHNRQAGTIIDKNIARVKTAVGLRDADIVRVPVLYRIESDGGAFNPNNNYEMAAYLPNAVNAVVLDNHTVLVPEQQGPRIGGRDVYGDAVAAAYAKAGLTVSFVNDYDLLHRGGGNIHCGTNALRSMTPYALRQP